MTAGSGRVFASKLQGLPVFDPAGDAVGRVRDVVVTLRTPGQPPRVLGLVVEVQRRRIFVAMGKVRVIEAGTVVLGTSTLSLKTFEHRVGEVSVVTELFDRRVTRTSDATTVTIVDAGLELTRTSDWLLTKVAVRAPRRRSPVEVIEWDDITGMTLTPGSQGAANLLAAMEKLNASDLAAMMQELPEKRRREVAAALDDERLADVFEELPEDDQVKLIGTLADERAADVLEEMDPGDAADLLSELPDDVATRLLELMEPEEADPVRQLMAYADDTAGGIMTNEPIVLTPNTTVAEALARIRMREIPPAIAAQVYVVRPPTQTPTGKYVGTAHFQRLLREPPSVLVAAVVETDVDPIGPEMALRELTKHLATYNLVAAPVVDEQGRLLGAVTVDDVLDHVLPDDWRDR